MPHSYVYGRAEDLCKDFPFSEIESDDGVDKICKALHKKGALSEVSNTYYEFLSLSSIKR